MKNHTSATPSLLGIFVLLALMLGMFLTISMQGGSASEEASGNWKSGKKNMVKEVKSDPSKELIKQVKMQYIKFR
jgi:hypothetical protein